MEMKVRREKEPTNKKYIALKATPFSIEEEESSEYNGEDFAMLIQKVGRIFYKKGRQNFFQRGRPQERFEKKKKKEMGPCYHYKKTGHLIADCPLLQATTSRKMQKKKKAMVATWDDLETKCKEEMTPPMCVLWQTERRLLR